jgi:hypothetical protein
MFRQAAGDDPRLASIVTGNPHNMTFRVGIQLGLLGVAVLYAMWGAHLLLFAGRGLIAWLGLAWVVSDIISSVFLSHLFDFTTGWTYVFGVGVLGGMLLREDIAAHAPDRLTEVGWRPVANAANE